MSEVVLVAGTPGVKTPYAVKALLDWIAVNHPDARSQWTSSRKFEDILIEVAGVMKLSDLFSTPKPELRSMWKQAVTQLGTELEAASAEGATRILVPIHLVWFHERLQEYISVLDAQALEAGIAGHQLTQVVCLIDDIHDSYSRLRGRDGLYDSRVRWLEPQEAKRGYAFRRHQRILEWRSREISAAETIAGQLGSRFTVLATKHQVATAFLAFSGEPQVYLSHPISEVRRLEQLDDSTDLLRASDLKSQLWALQEVLSQDVPLLQPTTIDELRPRTEANGRAGLATRFYPLAAYGNASATLFASTGTNGDNVIYDDLGDEPFTLDDDERLVSGELGRMVNPMIVNQVTARDLQLVTQAHDLVVLRPRFNGNPSGGVKEEIAYFQALRDHDPTNRGDVLLLDTAEDRQAHAPRQYVETLLAAHHRLFELTGGRDAPSTSPQTCVHALRRETRSAIRQLAAAGSERAAAETVLDGVLEDLYQTTAIRICSDAPKERQPLGQGPYVGSTGTLQSFLRRLEGAILPLEEIPPYSTCQTIDITGMSPSAVRNGVLDALR